MAPLQHNSSSQSTALPSIRRGLSSNPSISNSPSVTNRGSGNTNLTTSNVPRLLPPSVRNSTATGPPAPVVSDAATNTTTTQTISGIPNRNVRRRSSDISMGDTPASPTLTSVTQAFMNLRSYFQEYYNQRASNALLTSAMSANPHSNVSQTQSAAVSGPQNALINNTQRLLALRRIRLARELRESGTLNMDIPSVTNELNPFQRRRLSNDSNSDASSDSSPGYTWAAQPSGEARRTYTSSGNPQPQSFMNDSDDDVSDDNDSHDDGNYMDYTQSQQQGPRRDSMDSMNSSSSTNSTPSFSAALQNNESANRLARGAPNVYNYRPAQRPRRRPEMSMHQILEQHYTQHQHQYHQQQQQQAAQIAQQQQQQTNNHHFRYKIVCRLTCRSCDRELCNRGMKAILLADTKVELYSTDCPPLRAVEMVNKDYVTENCHCRIQDIACLGCGNVVGYHVTQPCQTCLESCNNGHFWMFQMEGVLCQERMDHTGQKPLLWAFLPPVDRDAEDEQAESGRLIGSAGARLCPDWAAR